MKLFISLVSLAVILASTNVLLADIVLDYPLGSGDPYYDMYTDGDITHIDIGGVVDGVDMGPVILTDHSLVQIYVGNEDIPEKYKEWVFNLLLPTGATEVPSSMTVTYYDDPCHTPASAIGWDFPSFPTTPDYTLGSYDVYVIDSYLDQYLGTTPDGSGLNYNDIGNPACVSFELTIESEVANPGVIIDDECIPEPMTMSLVGLGSLLLLRRRRRTH